MNNNEYSTLLISNCHSIYAVLRVSLDPIGA